jgi:trk system potassium uptake protein TrkH
MNLLIVQRILGLLLMLFSLTMLPPIGVSLYFADGNWQPFADAFVALLCLGAIVWWPVRKRVRELRVRDGFLVVALFWAVLGIAGAAPLLLSQRVEMSVTDAVFEAVSGFTTTGATVIVGLDTLPKSLLYYRNQIEWFGGIGIVVLAVALLPMLGVGGMQLLRAETPGPVKDTKLTPRITETAKVLWLLYVALTATCAAAFWLAGMTPFDAIAHSFSTVSTGGHSTHDASIGYFDNVAIEVIAVIFMFIGSVNFSLHFLAWRQRHLVNYFRDPEFKAFVWLLVVSTLLYTGVLWSSHMINDPGKALRVSLFQAVSMQSSSGFITDNFSHWPGALPVIVMLSTFIGGCAGSTSGGMKVVRWLLMWKQGQREVAQLVHPSAELPVKLGRKAIDKRIIDAVWGFFAVYVVSFGVLMVLLIAVGEDQVTAFSAIAACINNTGTGLGEVSANFTSLNEAGKWICVLAMLLGRLEVFPLLVLVAPTFWRR